MNSFFEWIIVFAIFGILLAFAYFINQSYSAGNINISGVYLRVCFVSANPNQPAQCSLAASYEGFSIVPGKFIYNVRLSTQNKTVFRFLTSTQGFNITSISPALPYTQSGPQETKYALEITTPSGGYSGILNITYYYTIMV